MWYASPLAYGLVAVKTFEKQTVLVLHARPIVPLLPWVICHSCGLAVAIGIAMLDGYQIAIAHCLTIGDCKWAAHDRSVEWTPNVDDAVTTL
jgi:hypothetical protein